MRVQLGSTADRAGDEPLRDVGTWLGTPRRGKREPTESMSAHAQSAEGLGDGPTVRLTIPAKPEYITLVRLALSGLSRLRPLSEETLGDLKLAVTEACSNSVRHGYGGGEGTVEILYELQPDRFVVEVADDGPGFDVERRPGRRERSRGGRPRHRDHQGRLGRVRGGRTEQGPRFAASLRQVPRQLAARPGYRAEPPGIPMLQLVDVGKKSIADYASLASRGVMDEIRRLAEPLAGKRVVHLSATAFGGGVAEINYALVPLMKDVGLDVEWRIIKGDDEFFGVTKAIHNALQGDLHGLTTTQEDIFRRYNAMNAEEFEDDYDFVIVHDPQPAALIDHFPESSAQLDLALPHRPLDSEPRRPRLPRAVARALRRVDLPHAAVRAAARRAARGLHLAARDRSADAEEHGSLAPRTRRTSSTSSASTSSGRS